MATLATVIFRGRGPEIKDRCLRIYARLFLIAVYALCVDKGARGGGSPTLGAQGNEAETAERSGLSGSRCGRRGGQRERGSGRSAARRLSSHEHGRYTSKRSLSLALQARYEQLRFSTFALDATMSDP
jgi:hypothetical protein